MSKSILVNTLALFVVTSLCANAEVDKSNEVMVPVSATDWVPCANNSNGEVVQVDAYIHILSFAQSNQNNTSWHFLVNSQTGQAVGQTTGTVYHITGSPLVEAEHYATDGAPDVYRLVWIKRGVGQNTSFVISDLIHVTINADGTTTVQMEVSNVECR